MRISGGGSSTPAGWPLTWWNSTAADSTSTAALCAAINTLSLWGIVIEAQLKFADILFDVQTADAVNLYDVGLYNSAGALVAHVGARSLPSTGLQKLAVIGGPITLPPGRYYVASTGNALTAAWNIVIGGVSCWAFVQATSFGASVGGALPVSIAPPADSPTNLTSPVFALSI